MAQQQKSYLKDTTDFINFIEKTKVPADAILVSMDVTSLYTYTQTCTHISQEEGIHEECRAYEAFYINEPPILRGLLEKALGFILYENSFTEKKPPKSLYSQAKFNGSCFC